MLHLATVATTIAHSRSDDDIVAELVEWLNQVDLAYRTELKDANELNFARFDAKLNAKIDQLDAKLNAKIEQLDAKLNAKIEQLDAKLNAKIDQIDAKLDVKIDQ